MLQIITGKFFKSEDRYLHDGKGILYSNYHWVQPVKTVVGTLEPIDLRARTAPYVFSYVNQIEKEHGRTILVRTGDSEVVEQFRLLCAFGLRGCFADDRIWVEHLCRADSTGLTDEYVPSRLLPRYFQPRIDGTQSETSEFSKFVAKVMSLRRTDYRRVMAALHAFDGALEALSTNMDLAYSMLVYTIESLSQQFDEYVPVWEHYEEKSRIKLDEILANVSSEAGASVRAALLEGSFLKLKVRFEEFVLKHVAERYYTTEAANVSQPIRMAQLRRAVGNAYALRSGYAHSLEPVLHQLKVPQISQNDVFVWDYEPYFTITGLVRLCDHVIRNVIEGLESVDREDFNWRDDLPGIITMKVAPQYWIHKADRFVSSNASQYYEGFLIHFGEEALNGKPICNLGAVMEKIETLVGQASPAQRRTMLAFYWLYNACLASGLCRPNWQQLLDKYKPLLESFHVELATVGILLDNEFPWTDWKAEEGLAALKEYDKTRFRAGFTHLPPALENAIVVGIANRALSEGRRDDHRGLIERARLNSPGQVNLQDQLARARDAGEAVPIDAIISRKTANKTASQ